MASSPSGASSEERLTGGKFYGCVVRKQAVGGAIFTELNHSQARKLPAHSHELPFFCLFLSGDYAEKYCHRDVQFRPFTLSFRPAGNLHQDAVGPRGARMFGIEVESHWQRLMESGSSDLRIGYDFAGGESLWLALKLYRETSSALDACDLQVESLVSELLGGMACKPEHCTVAPLWLRRIHDKLNAEFRERITMDDLAREAGVHPVHLSRMFRRFTRRGIGEYLHRLRVREACERMMDPNESLAHISYGLGFADQSHFTRVFREFTGMSPGVFRATLIQQSLTSPASPSLRPSSSSFFPRP